MKIKLINCFVLILMIDSVDVVEILNVTKDESVGFNLIIWDVKCR